MRKMELRIMLFMVDQIIGFAVISHAILENLVDKNAYKNFVVPFYYQSMTDLLTESGEVELSSITDSKKQSSHQGTLSLTIGNERNIFHFPFSIVNYPIHSS
jgi:hypothetical protein